MVAKTALLKETDAANPLTPAQARALLDSNYGITGASDGNYAWSAIAGNSVDPRVKQSGITHGTLLATPDLRMMHESENPLDDEFLDIHTGDLQVIAAGKGINTHERTI